MYFAYKSSFYMQKPYVRIYNFNVQEYTKQMMAIEGANTPLKNCYAIN